MKITTLILSLIALGLIIFNAFKLNFNAIFQGESVVALIMIFSSLCAIFILQIFRTSKKIEKLSKQRN